MELIGINFIGPFPKFDGIKNRWILIAVEYFSWYIWAAATEKKVRYCDKFYGQDI